ncbi:hypothetical protein SRHO_G00276270 [Serrasalmus rhombeus]
MDGEVDVVAGEESSPASSSQAVPERSARCALRAGSCACNLLTMNCGSWAEQWSTAVTPELANGSDPTERSRNSDSFGGSGGVWVLLGRVDPELSGCQTAYENTLLENSASHVCTLNETHVDHHRVAFSLTGCSLAVHGI